MPRGRRNTAGIKKPKFPGIQNGIDFKTLRIINGKWIYKPHAQSNPQEGQDKGDPVLGCSNKAGEKEDETFFSVRETKADCY